MSAVSLFSSGTRSLGPMVAAGALAVAAAAYILPLPGLAPPAWTGPDLEELARGPASTSPKGPPEGLTIKAENWVALAPTLDKLREPVQEVAKGADTPTGGDGPTLPPPPPPDPPLAWRFRGFIREPGRMVALVDIDEAQRLVVEGETVPEHGGSGDSIEVIRIEPDRLVVRRAGKEVVLLIEASTPESEAARRTLVPKPPLGRK